MRRAAFFSSGGFWYPVSDRLRRLVRSRTFPAGFRGAAATLSQPVACCCEPRRRAARCETRLPKRPDCAAWPFRKSDSISDDGRTFRIRFDSAAVSDRRFCLGAVWRCPLAFCYPPPAVTARKRRYCRRQRNPFHRLRTEKLRSKTILSQLIFLWKFVFMENYRTFVAKREWKETFHGTDVSVCTLFAVIIGGGCLQKRMFP